MYTRLLKKVVSGVGMFLSFFVFTTIMYAATSKTKDISKLRYLPAIKKRPRMVLYLPKNNNISKALQNKGVKVQKWIFKPVEDVRKYHLSFWENKRKEWKKILENKGDPEKNLKLSPAGEKILKNNIQICGPLIQKINLFFDSVRIAVVDPADPTTAFLIRTVEINKAFKLKDAVIQRKKTPPPWRLGRITRDQKILSDKENKWFSKFKWEGHELLFQYKKVKQPQDTGDTVFYDSVFFYRKTLRNGRTFLFEIYGYWTKSQEKDAKFAMTIAYLLSRLRFLD